MILSTHQIKHRKLLIVSFSYLAEIFKAKGTNIVAFRGIPEDAKLLGVSVNVSLEAIELLFEHQDFPEVNDCIYTTPSLDFEGFGIFPEAFCDSCRESWREQLDKWFKPKDNLLDTVWKK